MSGSSGMDFYIGVIVSVIVFCLVVFGFSAGRESAASDCRDFGAFKVEKQRYACSADGVSK